MADSDRVPQIFDRPNKTLSLNYIYTVTPTMVNEFLGTTSLDDVGIFIDTSAGLFDRTKYGVTYPYIFPAGKEILNRIPTVFIHQFRCTVDGGPYPSHSSGPIYDFSDNFTWIAREPHAQIRFPLGEVRPERLGPDQRVGRPGRHQQSERALSFQ